MKVLVISATFPPMRSGGSDFAFRLCRQLAEAGAEIRVLTSRIENVVTDPKIRVYPLMSDWSWVELPRLLWLARRFRPDVVDLHFNGQIYNDQPMVTFVPTFIKRLLPSVRVVMHVEYPSGVRPQLLARSTRAVRKVIARWAGKQNADYGYGTLLRDCDRIILLSDIHRLLLLDHFAGVNEKSVLIPPPPILPMCTEANGAARRRGRKMLGVSSDEFLIAYFGYIYPEKGIETLLQAFHLVLRHNDKVRLVIVGGSNEISLKGTNRPNYFEELRDLSKRLEVADKVIWTGYYPTDSDYASLCLRGADVCVLPFDRGVYLNNSSFAAAAAHGLPIITTKGGTIEFPLTDQRNVLLCPPKEPRALAQAIECLASRPELRQRLGEGALDLARQWFSWDKALERTIETFKVDT